MFDDYERDDIIQRYSAAFFVIGTVLAIWCGLFGIMGGIAEGPEWFWLLVPGVIGAVVACMGWLADFHESRYRRMKRWFRWNVQQ